MKYKYEFITSEECEIEVSREWGEILCEMDRMEFNNDHTQTRRRASFTAHGDGGYWLTTEQPAIYLECAGHLFCYGDKRFIRGYEALTRKQKILFKEVYCNGISLKEYAEKMNITQSAAVQQNSCLKKTFRKFLLKP